MQSIQVGQFKSEFSTIINNVQNFGEKYIIEYGKKHKKVAMLVPYEEEVKQARQFGIYDGKYKIPDNFDNNEDMIELVYGSSIEP